MIRFLAALMLAVHLASAAEVAVFRSGFRLEIERHEQEGAEVILYSAEGGQTRLPADQIVAFETVPSPRTAASAAESPPPPAPRLRTLSEQIDEAARRHGLPEEFVHAVVATESAYRQDAVSPKGAIGLMQLMPDTARSFGADPRDPEQNLEAGVRFLRDLLIRYEHDANRALAAYNAGPGAVDRHGGVPPYLETQWYVSRVLQRYVKSAGKKPGRADAAKPADTIKE
jgi:soluble lytic murein transglycosylase-like protein